MNRKITTLTILFFLGFILALSAQPAVILEYYDNFSGDLRVMIDGEEMFPEDLEGEELPPGSTLVTESGDYAELRLEPAGTIIRISENTNFTVQGLQGRDKSDENVFAIAHGKFRAVVAKGRGDRYRFQGPTAVCGVRGTDMGMLVERGVREVAFVLDGAVDYTNAAGQQIALQAGQLADAMAAAFQALALTPAMVSQYGQDLEFVELSKEDVSGYAPAPETGAEEPTPEERAKAKEAQDTMLGKAMQILGIEIGAVTIGDQTYAKVIAQPRFSLGKFKFALYLPVIYQSNMLDPDDWYRPDGNYEWSFGADQDRWDRIARDFVTDLFLKFRYIQYGEQRDPFYLKLGNLNNITLGHGTIMRNYANDSDFPAIRRVGLNVGGDIKEGKAGYELMVNDAADPEIFGARFFFKPAASLPLAVGLSGVTDTRPDVDRLYGDPLLINGGLDLDLPLIEKEILSIIMFADVALMLPYYREPVGTVDEGLAWDAVWDGEELRNWGFATGLFGNILPIDYRLEFRYEKGTYKNAFYNSLYDRLRADYAAELSVYLNDPDNPVYNTQTMGIYGEAGFTIEKIFYLEAGYLWPWYVNDTGGVDKPDDYIHVKAGIIRGLLPIYASIAYDRTRFVPDIQDGSFDWFNEKTVLSGELVYPVAPMLDLAAVVASNYLDGENYISVSILTRANY
jgi:hypothetical protein